MPSPSPRSPEGGTPFAAAAGISRLGPDRSGDCARVHASSFRAPWGAAEIEDLLGAQETIAHGAIHPSGEGLVGLVLSRVAADEAEVLTLAVEPAHRRRGVASRLIEVHLTALVAAGVARLFLEVGESNLAARALYARTEFYPVGERQGYYRSGSEAPATALVLRRDLEKGAA